MKLTRFHPACCSTSSKGSLSTNSLRSNQQSLKQFSSRSCNEELQGDQLQPASSPESHGSFQRQSWQLASFKQLFEGSQLLGLESLQGTRACKRRSLRHQLQVQRQELCFEAQSFAAWLAGCFPPYRARRASAAQTVSFASGESSNFPSTSRRSAA